MEGIGESPAKVKPLEVEKTAPKEPVKPDFQEGVPVPSNRYAKRSYTRQRQTKDG